MSINQPRKPSGRFDVTPGREPVGVDLTTPRRYTTSVEQEAFLDSAEVFRRDAGDGFTKVRVDGPDPDSFWPDEKELVSFEATPAAVAEYLEEYELDEDTVTPVPPKWPVSRASAKDAQDVYAFMADHPLVSPSDVSRSLSMSPAIVDEAFGRLVSSGMITEQSDGKMFREDDVSTLPDAQPIDMAQRQSHRSAEETIAASLWSTRDLQGFALGLQSYDDYTKPVWAQVAHTEADAREYYAGLLEQNPEQARSEAAEALAMTGWTARAIGLKKS